MLPNTPDPTGPEQPASPQHPGPQYPAAPQYGPPQYGPPVPPAPPARKGHWFTSRAVIAIVALVVGILIGSATAGGGSDSGKGIAAAPKTVTTTVSVPDPTVTDDAATDPASDPASDTSSAPAAPTSYRVGDAMSVTKDSADAASITVTSVKTSRVAKDEYSGGPEKGYFVTVHLKVAVRPDYTAGFNVSSMDFYLVVNGQHYEEGDGNSYSAPGSDDDLPSGTLNAGESGSGNIVFDAPRAHGKIAYAPNYEGGPLGYWTF